MLTCKTISPQLAVEYFLKGYYLEGTSRWFGKGAENLGLQGAVDNEQVFTNIVQGLSPDGATQLCSKKLESKNRRAALDCTFSAPKSVSLTALVFGDERLLNAHHLAVEKTLELMQERYAHTRVMKGSDRQIVNTGNLVVAEFDHIETRELDPHLHTHALVMNMTQVSSGEWYSHHNSAVYANKKFLGMVYQQYLALEVQKLGYEISLRAHGQFDIKGYTEEQLMDFSKRRQQILAAAGPSSSWLQREKAWESTRRRKEKVQPEELKAKWLSEAQALGITFVLPKEPKACLPPNEITQKSLEDAIAHCSERTVAFRQEDLEKFILSSGQPVDITELEPSIKENAELLRVVEPNGVRFTTNAALQRELATIRLMQQGQETVAAIAHPSTVEEHLSKTTLNSGQRQAVSMAATTTDSFVAWQGVAGAGKTYALKELKSIATVHGYSIKGFAPSSQAASVLGEELGIEANTVAGLLVSKRLEEIQPNQIWIVDEAGLLGAKDADQLLQRATKEQARVILVGDTKQLSAVEAGNPFKSLQQAGIRTAYLNEPLRQRTPELKLAVDLIASGRVEDGLARLDDCGCIQEVTEEQLRGAIAAEYMAVPLEERAATLVLAGTNTQRLEITQAIRSALKKEGSLGIEATVTQLKAKNLTNVQMSYTHHFDVGDVVMPTRNYKRRGLEKGELYSVECQTPDRLTLKAADGRHLTVDTDFSKAVYERHLISVAVGDRLKWTKNDRKLGRRNGQEFTVTAIKGDSAQIQDLDDGKSETINLTQGQHLDYALVSTTYSSQGKTANRVLIAADSTIGIESFYVAVSRAKYNLKLYTEDKDELLRKATLSKAKENPLELLRQQVRLSDFLSQLNKVPSSAVLARQFDHSVQEAATTSNPEQEDKPMDFTLVHANTYHNRKAIKALGGKWDADKQGWKMPSIEAYDKARALCETCQVDTSSDRASPPRLNSPPAQSLHKGSSSVEPPVKVNDNPNTNSSRRNNDTKDPTNTPTINGTSAGRRASSRLATSNGQVESIGCEAESIGGEANPRIRAYSERFRELGINLRKHSTRGIGNLNEVDLSQFTADRTTGRVVERVRQLDRVVKDRRESIKALADSVRELPLEDVALSLGLEPDRRDKHKWRGEGQIISINDQKFYDHLALKGGYGAIDLVMHVQERNFKEALDWLSNGASYLPPPLPRERSPQQKTSLERQPFQPPVPDEAKWPEVRQYLVEKRGLPEQLVESLHAEGLVYASGVDKAVVEKLRGLGHNGERLTNAVFLRCNQAQEATGASLRSVVGDFKGLATGTRRDQGWFAFTQGEGQLERIVLTESPIDAMSAAALAKQETGATMFIATDGAGAVPIEMLRQYQVKGMRVVVGVDADPAGEEMALKVMAALPGAVRAKPTYGKDWNEQLLQQRQAVARLNQLSDRDFQKLYQNVTNYLNTAPPRPPSLAERQFVQADVDKHITQINDLWTQQEKSASLISSMQKNPFRTWNKEYESARTQLEETMSLISQSIAQKEHKENQLKEWEKQDETYQTWQHDPRTIEIKGIAEVFKLPHMQQRLINIRQELHRQQQYNQQQHRQQDRELTL